MTKEKNKLAIITGGNSGIGKATALALAQNGWEVHVADKSTSEIHSLHSNITSHQCDITDQGQLDAVAQKIFQTIGIPDLLVSNAGKGIHEKLSEGDPEKWKDVLDLNIGGTLRFIRAFVPPMREKGGYVIFISSVAAVAPYAYGGVYAASKAAVNVIAETLRLEEQPKIRVTTISPGVVHTAFFKHMISGSQTPESIGWGGLSPEMIADEVLHIVERPAEAAINNIVIRPPAQPL